MGDPPEIDGATFRKVLGNCPTSVTIVTADDDGPCGMVIGSFGSVSLDPPLVQFMPTKDSGTWERIARSGGYCVNVLGADQLDLSNSFLDREKDPFEDLSWRPGPSGSPILEGTLAHIDCAVGEIVDAGDHYIVIGKVLELNAGDSDASPLLFFQGGYGQFVPLEAE